MEVSRVNTQDLDVLTRTNQSRTTLRKKKSFLQTLLLLVLKQRIFFRCLFDIFFRHHTLWVESL